MVRNKIILLGAGGHCKSCIEAIESNGEYEIEGILNKGEEVKSVLGYPVLGGDELIDQYIEKGFSFLITVGQISSPAIRLKLYNYLKERKAHLLVISAFGSVISKHAKIGEGSVILHQAVINADAIVGNNCIINTGAIIEHDSLIGDHCHISTKAVINGGVKVGDGVFVGSGSVIFNNVNICNNVVIGGGSTVVKDITAEGVYFNDKKLIRKE